MTDEPAVKVTLPVIYEKLLDVERKVDPIPLRVEDHETRIRALERTAPRVPWTTILTVVIAGAALIASLWPR